MAVDPAACTVYVIHAHYVFDTGTVSVIDGATSAVTATIPVGLDPAGVAVDPGTHTAHVANSESGTVSVISRCGWDAPAF